MEWMFSPTRKQPDSKREINAGIYLHRLCVFLYSLTVWCHLFCFFIFHCALGIIETIIRLPLTTTQRMCCALNVFLSATNLFILTLTNKKIGHGQKDAEGFLFHQRISNWKSNMSNDLHVKPSNFSLWHNTKGLCSSAYHGVMLSLTPLPALMLAVTLLWNVNLLGLFWMCPQLCCLQTGVKWQTFFFFFFGCDVSERTTSQRQQKKYIAFSSQRKCASADWRVFVTLTLNSN